MTLLVLGWGRFLVAVHSVQIVALPRDLNDIIKLRYNIT